jgi:signal peptidase I
MVEHGDHSQSWRYLNRKRGHGGSLTLGKKMNRFSSRPFRFVVLVGITFGGVWLSGVRLFGFPGESMLPAVQPGDYFVGLVGLWGNRTPARFDMLIFDVPSPSKWAERKIPWMKRLVGLPGEHVRLSGADLFINGRKIGSNLLHSNRAVIPAHDFEVQLRSDEFCVLGDNLDESLNDSRSLGPISRSLVKGRAVFVVHRSKRKEPNKAPETTPAYLPR